MGRFRDQIRILGSGFLFSHIVVFCLPMLSIRQEYYSEQTYSQYLLCKNYLMTGTANDAAVSGGTRIMTVLLVLLPLVFAIAGGILQLLEEPARRYGAVCAMASAGLYLCQLCLGRELWPKRLNNAQQYVHRVGWWLLLLVVFGVLVTQAFSYLIEVQKKAAIRQGRSIPSGAQGYTLSQTQNELPLPSSFGQSDIYREKTPAQPHYLSPGTVLGGHFIVGTVIGAGNYGITYRCYDETLGVVVAVKEFFPVGFVSREPGESRVSLLMPNQGHRYRDKVQRFLMEARSIAQFGKAKDIVNVYDYFEENNTAYLIMEYIDDLLLRDYMEQHGRIEVRTALRITESLLEAVKKLHAKGIVHCDISPDNLFIANDLSIKLFDFGSASLKDSQTTGETVIKPGYTAPEQYSGAEEVRGYYTDLYSIGAILYHMVTGVRPQEASERQRKDTLKTPTEWGVRIDPLIERAIMEALAVKTELRCQTISQFDEAVHGRRRAEYPQEKIKRRKRTRSWLITVSVLLAIAACLGGTVLFHAFHGQKNILFDTVVTEDTLTVWVDTEGMQGMLEEVAAEMQHITDGDSGTIRRIKQESQQITYHIVNVADDGKTMEQALQDAKGTDAFPDVFVSDRVSDLGEYALVSYDDNVALSINGKKHLYLSQYQEMYHNGTEMPTSFDVLLLYAIGTTDTESIWYQQGSAMADMLVSDPAEMQEDKILVSSLLGQQKTDGTMDLQTICQANADGTEYTYLGSERVEQLQKTAKGKEKRLVSTEDGWETAAELSILAEPDGFDVQQGKFRFGTAYLQTMQEMAEMNDAAKEACRWRLTDDADSADYLYGNSILAGSGYRSVLSEAKIGNRNIPYEVYVPTANGKMLVMHTGKLAISEESSDNKQVAGMRLVYFALEQQHSNSNHDTTYPLSRAEGQQTNSFTSFFEVNPVQSAVEELVEKWSYPCVLIGCGSGNMHRFAAGLEQMDREEDTDYEEWLDAYSEEYQKTQNADVTE